MPGPVTSEVEVTNVEAITRVERPTPAHLYWPELDVDLSVDSIEHPDRYPLKAKG